MGLFNFFQRRRDRESAIPQDSLNELTEPAAAEPAPVGQAFETVGQQPINLNLGGGAVDVAGVLGMITQAMTSGNLEVHQGSNQVIDLRGSGLREDIMKAMQESGLDPAGMEGQSIQAGDYAGLQETIVKRLQEAGVELDDLGPAFAPPIEPGELDGDGSR